MYSSLCNREQQCYKVVLDMLFNCINWFSVVYGVEVPENLKTICHYTYLHIVSSSYHIFCRLFYLLILAIVKKGLLRQAFFLWSYRDRIVQQL